MNQDQVLKSISFITAGKYAGRTSVSWDEFGRLNIRMDLHELHKRDVEVLMKNLLLITKGVPFTLDLIHGYNHGTVLRDYIREELESPRIQEMYCPYYNEGETILKVA